MNGINIQALVKLDQIAYFDVSQLFSNDRFHLQQRLCLLVHVNTILGGTLRMSVSMYDKIKLSYLSLYFVELCFEHLFLELSLFELFFN
jgi:hypothetical protein